MSGRLRHRPISYTHCNLLHGISKHIMSILLSVKTSLIYFFVFSGHFLPWILQYLKTILSQAVLAFQKVQFSNSVLYLLHHFPFYHFLSLFIKGRRKITLVFTEGKGLKIDPFTEEKFYVVRCLPTTLHKSAQCFIKNEMFLKHHCEWELGFSKWLCGGIFLLSCIVPSNYHTKIHQGPYM
jgi:hypothetical protein